MLVLLSLATCLARFAFAASPTIKLGHTTLVGRDVSILKQDFFGGIPYAEPPVGKLRLRPPMLKTSLNHNGTFNATDFGLACFQLGFPLSEMSEDCLTINVLRPSGLPANATLPVLFWVYGGGFVNGTASLYNGSEIVAQSVARGTPVIYVNFNYRLGPLGFPQGREAEGKGALNLGLKDLIAALEWVQCNIGIFGGDKDKVTIFGESAGSVMISLLYLNSPIHSLGQAAILESGSQASGPLITPSSREDDWGNFVGGVASCGSTTRPGSTFGCLQAANTSEIFHGVTTAAAETTNLFTWDPSFDGPGGLIPDLPSILLKQGKFARLPFIAGTNEDEGTAFVSLFIGEGVNSSQQIRDFVLAFSSPALSPPALERAIDELLQVYPDVPALGSPFNTGNETFGLSSEWKRACAIVGDLMFQSQRRLWMNAAAAAGVVTYGYLFTQPQIDLPPQYGVHHGGEIASVYGDSTDPSESASLISRTMIDYWVSFATSLDPNDGLGSPRPKWGQFTPKNKALMQLNGDNTTMIPDDFRAGPMGFMDSNPTIWRQ